ncbi:hypothetical protein HDV00_001432 [Rhizophlyctis rosea]|nr:hypothetical protein HDV00_001432 [Rhizophlyctis rosea]
MSVAIQPTPRLAAHIKPQSKPTCSSPSPSLPSPPPSPISPHIIDLRGATKNSNTTSHLRNAVASSLQSFTTPFYDSRLPPNSAERAASHKVLRSIPTMVLYDDKGLDIFDQITYNEDYYLTGAEMDIFERFGEEMVRDYIKDGDVLIELGCGSMRKTKSLLQSIIRQRKDITYYAVDLSETSLRTSLQPLTEAFPDIHFTGLLGTYDDALAWAASNLPSTMRKTYLWLGSSIGNLNRVEAAKFLRNVNDHAMQTGDLFLCGIDRRNDPAKVGLAYNDRKGDTREFILNGLDHINAIFGETVIDRNNFEYVSIYNPEMGRHEAYYKSKLDHTVGSKISTPHFSVTLQKDELINVEYSVKYSTSEVSTLVTKAGFYHVGKWTDSTDSYNLHLFQKPPFTFTSTHPTTATLTPTLSEWNTLWQAWDTVTTTMIPSYAEQPISLRHPFIFYLGHIPAFLDIQISRALKEPYTEPQEYTRIFERGIDPDVEDPTQCHDHSEVPEAWPELGEILAYRDRVRARIRGVLTRCEGGGEEMRRVRRVLWMCFEHEGMHLETILYMLVQSPSVRPPLHFARPILPATNTIPLPSAQTVTFSNPNTITIGINDPDESDLDPSVPASTLYGWDNEKPAREVVVDPFEIQTRKVTVGEWAEFLNARGWEEALVPASWGVISSSSSTSSESGEGETTPQTPPSPSTTTTTHGVKTPFGLIPLAQAWRWPVYVSYDQASTYAVVKGMRLPTEGELRFVRRMRRRSASAKKVVVSDGEEVEEEEEGGNVGFVKWTPVDVECFDEEVEEGKTVEEKAGRVKGLVGDGWEMTSTVFERYGGFKASEMYPGYSEDFFDTKHNILLGGSWATVPRIAGRESFTNWYQRNYMYVFAGFRLARSL